MDTQGKVCVGVPAEVFLVLNLMALFRPVASPCLSLIAAALGPQLTLITTSTTKAFLSNDCCSLRTSHKTGPH